MNYKIFTYNLLCLILPIIAIFAWFYYYKYLGKQRKSNLGSMKKIFSLGN